MTRPSFLLILVAFAGVGLAANKPTMTLAGKVVSIADGDTLTVLAEKTQHRIRLEGIDAPESSQAFGQKAKQALGELVFGKEVKVEWKERDRYERIIGKILYEGRWINKEMVVDGWAWHYKQYSKDKELADAEASAKVAKKGLWADPNPVPPWEYRKTAKAK